MYVMSVTLMLYLIILVTSPYIGHYTYLTTFLMGMVLYMHYTVLGSSAGKIQILDAVKVLINILIYGLSVTVAILLFLAAIYSSFVYTYTAGLLTLCILILHVCKVKLSRLIIKITRIYFSKR